MNHEYKSMDITTLRKLCASRKFKYAYQMTKSKAIEMLEENDKDPLYVNDPETTIANRKKHLENQRKWVSANREKHLENQRKWVLANREKYLEYQKCYNASRRAVSCI